MTHRLLRTAWASSSIRLYLPVVVLSCLNMIQQSDPEDHGKRSSTTTMSSSILPLLFSRQPAYARWSTDTVGTPSVQELYDITDEVIGEGGYGIVTKGVDRKTGEIVALKQLCKRETSAQEFWAEVDLLRIAGKHPNIMSLRGVYETDDTWFIVQELATGGELFDHLVQNGAYSEALASERMRELASAIRHLHRKGIVHGDIKPENILLHHGEMCLVDFGVSFRLGERTSTREYSGTTAYSAPECLGPVDADEQQSNVTEAADMYAFGIVLYVLLCGVHPFDKHNCLEEEQIRHHILQNDLDLNADEFSQFLSEEARDLLAKLLQADPAQRITAEQALQHPWLLPTTQLDTTVCRDRAEQLQTFQRARRRLRASILAVLLNATSMIEEQEDSAPAVRRPDSSSPERLESSNSVSTWGISSKADSAERKARTMISALQVFDQDHKGYISKTDLDRVTSQHLGGGTSYNTDELSEMITAADGDPDHSPTKIEYDDVKMTVCSLRSLNFENGEVIIREGAASDHVFYLLMEGTVEASCVNTMNHSFFKRHAREHPRVVLRRIASGNYFGDLEMLQPDGKLHPRIASYKCVSPVCKVLTLLPDDFQTLTDVYESFESKTQVRVNEHAHEQLVKCIEHAKGHIRRLEYRAGDVIFSEGDQSDLFYIIVEGQVNVSRKGVRLETLAAGEYFPLGVSGRLERGLAKTRDTTVTCTRDTKVIEVGGDAFRSFLQSHNFMGAYFKQQVQSREKQRHQRQPV